jgi:hypothetical protein
LLQPWVLDGDAKILVSCKRLNFEEEASITVSRNEFKGPGEFALCLGDSVRVAELVFEAVDVGSDRVWLEEKTSSKRLSPLLSSEPDSAFDSVRVSLKSVARVDGKNWNPLQARILFDYSGSEPVERDSRVEPQAHSVSRGGQSDVSARGVAVTCRKTREVACSLSLFSSPCPNGFQTESVSGDGCWPFFKKAVCVKDYFICSARPYCDEGDDEVWRESCALPAG